jgi:hypothetical protein
MHAGQKCMTNLLMLQQMLHDLLCDLPLLSERRAISSFTIFLMLPNTQRKKV